ncbi:PREDICTED: dopamine receptor 2, partial [Ceratosolen solmsi marchali]|uniref:Dopamine receptor 2 n=1 Tax=Ceratosolen solmsi marchali TaxID=326594 RepID=A0AAJ6YDQ1_9HYME
YNSIWEITIDRIGLGILLFTFSFCTVFGNTLVIIAVVRERYLQTATNYFITSLAFADCLVGFVVMPFSVIYEIFEKRWLFNLNWCDTWRSLDVLFSTASILNLCVISVDRYWAIKDPFSYPSRMTYKLASILITCVWLASSLISFPAIVWWRAVRTNRIPHDKCPFTVNLEYIIFSSTISFYLPLFVMVFTYYKIYREAVKQTKSLRIGTKHVMIASGELELTLRMHRGGNLSDRNTMKKSRLFYSLTSASKNLQDLQNSQPKNKTLKTYSTNTNTKQSLSAPNKNFSLSRKFAKFSKEKKAAKTLGIVMGVFIICWLPFFVVNLLSGFCAKCIWREEIISTAVSWLGWINSAMNPVIYACWSRDFRRAFIRILCCCCPHRVKKQYQRAFRYK